MEQVAEGQRSAALIASANFWRSADEARGKRYESILPVVRRFFWALFVAIAAFLVTLSAFLVGAPAKEGEPRWWMLAVAGAVMVSAVVAWLVERLIVGSMWQELREVSTKPCRVAMESHMELRAPNVLDRWKLRVDGPFTDAMMRDEALSSRLVIYRYSTGMFSIWADDSCRELLVATKDPLEAAAVWRGDSQ